MLLRDRRLRFLFRYFKRPGDPFLYEEDTVTAMHREGMPLIRYRTGDLGRLTDKPCGCLKPRLDDISGRLGDSIRLKNGSC